MLDIKLETIDEVKALEYLTHSEANPPTVRNILRNLLLSKGEENGRQTAIASGSTLMAFYGMGNTALKW